MSEGRIHSIETTGMVDGPGIRYVIFTQGCLLRCQYCHNPDTWELGRGKMVSVQELMKDIKDYIPFMKFSGGGVTVTGGEPLLHAEYLTHLFKECNKQGVHTCIDSSGGCFNQSTNFLRVLDELLQVTDLILLDLKMIDPEKHRKLTGMSNEHILEFARYLSDRKIPVWIRHVLVPGLTDDEEDLRKLAAFIQTLENVQKIEILPYHEMGIHKWEHLGLDYALKGVTPPSDEVVAKAKEILAGTA
ncbi:pyruvate formate-lyase-activating protein [Ammoniphilus sp. 3BR4]|uniref:pyruvate formate-lyase-activating protein n=1 Tax=Ammoniphilus sp. 3BR4 TaxID=3158265 RepID=UPI0034677694